MTLCWRCKRVLPTHPCWTICLQQFARVSGLMVSTIPIYHEGQCIYFHWVSKPTSVLSLNLRILDAPGTIVLALPTIYSPIAHLNERKPLRESCYCFVDFASYILFRVLVNVLFGISKIHLFLFMEAQYLVLFLFVSYCVWCMVYTVLTRV